MILWTAFPQLLKNNLIDIIFVMLIFIMTKKQDTTPTNSGSQESIHSAESISEENFNKRLEDALQAMSRSTRNSLQRESTKVENKTNNNKHQAKQIREIK